MKFSTKSQVPAGYFPVASRELLSRIPIAGESLGWFLTDSEPVAGGWRFGLLCGRSGARGEVVLQEGPGEGWAHVEVRLANGASAPPARQKAFFDALTLLVRGRINPASVSEVLPGQRANSFSSGQARFV